MTHLILYDVSCPLCSRAIQFILKRDAKKKFAFSSLKGKTAGSFCNTLPISDDESVILIENFRTQKQRIYTKSQAVFRIFWNLGGIHKCMGWKYILPSWSIDWAYNFVVKRRQKICKVCKIKQPDYRKNTRFIP